MNLEYWFRGPLWLNEEAHDSEKYCLDEQELHVIALEEKREVISIPTVPVEEGWLTLFGQKKSNFSFSCRILGWVKRFIDNCRNPTRKNTNLYISIPEATSAEQIILKELQMTHFEREYKQLLEKCSVSRQSNLRHLNPFLDEAGLIRVGGRLMKAQLPFPQQHPIILPSASGLVKLLISECHRNLVHGGTQVTMNTLRKKFWILHSGNVVKGLLYPLA